MEGSPFHEVGNLFPDDVTPPETVTGETPVGEALRLMLQERYSQLPVVEHERVIGMFSLWSVARHLEQMPGIPIQDVPVREVMDRDVVSATVTDSLDSLLHLLQEHEAVLVSSPHGLQAIVTPTDALLYFYGVAHPFVLLQEIEMALRCLMEACVTEGQLAGAIDASLRKQCEAQDRPVPTTLDQLTMDQYRSLITCKSNWSLFERAFGPRQDLVAARLLAVRDLRNEILHFRRDTRSLSTLDYQRLVDARGWLLERVQRLQPQEGGNHVD